MKDYWREDESKNVNIKKIIILIAIIIIIGLIVTVIILYKKNDNFRNWIDVQILRKQVLQEKVTTIDLEENQNANIYAFNKYIGILNKNKLEVYGSTGNKEADLDVQIVNPLFNTANRFLAIGEQNGQKIYLIEDKKVSWEKEVEGNISQVYVNKNGYVAVTISGTSYKSIIQVFDSDGNPLFKKYLPSTLSVDVSISNDNKYLAIAEVDTSGTAIQSNVRIISIDKVETDPTNSEEESYKSESNKLLVNIEYENKNKIVCMYTDSISLIEDGKEKSLFDNKDKKVTAQSINLNNNFTIIQEESSGIFSANSLVSIQNIDNQETKNYRVDTVVKEIYTDGDIIALNLGTEVEFINTSGWLVKRYVANQEITKVTVSSNIAGIIYRDKVEIINF
ncbi:MAG: DUF5711 family protein [Clostridia bacterium]